MLLIALLFFTLLHEAFCTLTNNRFEEQVLHDAEYTSPGIDLGRYIPSYMLESDARIAINVAQVIALYKLYEGKDFTYLVNGTIDTTVPAYRLIGEPEVSNGPIVYAAAGTPGIGIPKTNWHLGSSQETWGVCLDENCVSSCRWTTSSSCQTFPPQYANVGFFNNPSGNTRIFTVWSQDGCTGSGLSYWVSQSNACININTGYNPRSYQFNA